MLGRRDFLGFFLLGSLLSLIGRPLKRLMPEKEGLRRARFWKRV